MTALGDYDALPGEDRLTVEEPEDVDGQVTFGDGAVYCSHAGRIEGFVAKLERHDVGND